MKALSAAPTIHWRQPSVMVAVLSVTIAALAFALSLETTFVSIRTNEEKLIHDQQAELASALRILQELHLKQIELHEKYKGNADEANAAGLINNEVYDTTLRAGDIAIKLGSYATSATIIPLSQRSYSYGQYTRAEELAQLALQSSKSIEDEIGALSWLGFMKIRGSQPDSHKEGNAFFQKAFEAPERGSWSVSAIPNVQWLKAKLQVDWSTALAPLNCDEARKHFSAASVILQSAPSSLDLDRLRAIVARRKASGIGDVPSCRP